VEAFMTKHRAVVVSLFSMMLAAAFVGVHCGSCDEVSFWPEDLVVEETAVPPPPARDKNQARLLINGEASFLERMKLIDEARRSIYIQALIFKADTVGTEIADRLLARKREDPELDIRIIVDAYSNIQDIDAQLLYFELMDGGIDVQGYEAFYLHWMNELNLRDWTAGNKRYHEKYWIIDGTKAVVGGMNVGDEYARVGTDPLLIWRDQDIYLEGPVVRDVQAAFLQNFSYFTRVKQRWPHQITTDSYWESWRGAHPQLRGLVTKALATHQGWRRAKRSPWDPEGLAKRSVGSPLVEDVSVQFIRSRPRVGESWIERAYCEHIDRAQHTVIIANAYFVPTPALKRSLLEAARRGVAVTVITNSKATNDIPIITDAGRLSYRELMEAGVEIYEWHAERANEGTLHAKYAVFDSEVAIIGSYNLDPRSRGLNSEDVVVVRDPRLATELHRRTLDTDLRLADRITPEQARVWADPDLVPLVDEPQLPWSDPRFDPDRFELFLMRQAERHL
jgi:phosphatidylserine/phosphatidylglycerophosphate/cardiolipin synthase-like enzyme